jgi:hypothetical protein
MSVSTFKTAIILYILPNFHLETKNEVHKTHTQCTGYLQILRFLLYIFHRPEIKEICLLLNYIKNNKVHFFFLKTMYRQTCIKRSPLGQRKSGLLRQVTSYQMEFSMTGQEKVGLLIQVTA